MAIGREELGRLYPVRLVAFRNEWESCFISERERIMEILGDGIRIEHIGSTAVPGLMAKPTVDVLVERPEEISDDELMLKFSGSGYIRMEEQKNHVMFVKGYTHEGLEDISYHIHIGPLSQAWLWDRVYFRDYLKENPEERERYEALKKELSARFEFDREAYTNGKSEYVAEITAKAKKFYE